ncbi:MAG TPA: methyltransferase domain-containing protein [Hyphomicrobiales bacterium]|nr:methyltransferase domain-containing protein [Hyphomicrobiales bacterium]
MIVVEERERVPVFANRLEPSAAAARAAPAGRLSLHGCRTCGFVQNAAYDPALVAFDPGYENDQGGSPAFRAHVEAVAAIVAAAVAAGTGVVEIGCGQGGFLAALAARLGPEHGPLIGFDPSFRGEDGSGTAGAQIFRRHFDPAAMAALDPAPATLVARHLIGYVPDPVGFFAAIGEALGTTPHRLFVETPDVGWIFRNGAFQDLFYETCSLHAPSSLARAFAAAGYHPESARPMMHGQYVLAQATRGGAAAAETPLRAAPALRDLRPERRDFVARWRSALAERRAGGGIAIWGAGAKGLTFAQLCDPDAGLIDALIDVNPLKQGHFAPLTAHPVEALSMAAARGLGTVIVANPAYRDEVAGALAAMDVAADILAIEDPTP